jgi:hypothetical protein
MFLLSFLYFQKVLKKGKITGNKHYGFKLHSPYFTFLEFLFVGDFINYINASNYMGNNKHQML